MEINLDLRQYIARKKWEFKREGDQLILKICPICGGSDWKFYIHSQTTQFTCYHKNNCGKVGNIHVLKDLLGDKKSKQVKQGKVVPEKHVLRWHENIKGRAKTLAYLHKRGITDEAIEHFKLGIRKVGGIAYLTIPHYDALGYCRNVKMRALQKVEKKDKWKRITGYPSILFNVSALDTNDTIVIAESELDAISYWVAGVHNIVGFTCGADSFKNEWYDPLADKDKLLIAFDMDKAGQKGAREIARRIGYDKVENVILPCNDPNQVLQELGSEELSYTLKTAEKFEIAGVTSMDNALVRLASRNTDELDDYIETPWPEVNNLIGRRLRPGHVFTLSARYKMGKCLGRDTPILMHDGHIKAVQDVEEGDLVMGPDSTPRVVQGVTSGVERSVRVIPSYGMSWQCNESHILYVRCNRKIAGFEKGCDYTMTVKEYEALTNGTKKYMRLVRTEVEYPTQEVPYDPYFIGLWLADGTRKRPAITTMDREAVDAVTTVANAIGAHVNVYEQKNNKSNVYDICFKRGQGNPLLTYLRNSCDDGEQKLIPHAYMCNDAHIRMELLAGILDGDGYLNAQQTNFEIASKSESLRDQYSQLAESLGFRTSKKIKEQGGRPYYLLLISGDLHRIPNRIERRQASRGKENRRSKNPLLTGFRIIDVGEQEYFGFTVDKDNLFLLGDTTITHNTTFAIQWQKWLSQVCGIPTLLACLEMSTDELAEKVTASVQMKDIDHLATVDFTLARAKLQDMPFYFLESDEDGTGSFDIDAIFQQMSDAVRRYGIKVLVFDHLHYLCRSIQHTTAEVGQVMRRFKTFARAHGIVVILIAQPKKLNGKRIKTDDLKDSVSVPTDSDWVGLLHREEIKRGGLREDDEDDLLDDEAKEDRDILSPVTCLTISAARHKGGGEVSLYYEGSLSTFFPMNKRKHPIITAFRDQQSHDLFF